MGIGNTNTAGGASLNFKVVGGTTEPANPTENMIWVNSDKKIPSWYFGEKVPDLWAFVEEAGTVLGTLNGRTYVKNNNGRAVYAFCKMDFSGPILVSTDPNAVVTSFEGFESNPHSGTVTVDGIVYYYNSFGGFADVSIDQIIPSFTNLDSNENHAIRLAKLLATNKSAEGTVWFPKSTSGSVSFNALKKNGIQVYPSSVKQWVSGELKDVTAKIYQGGEWRLLVHELYLYNNGTFADADGGLKQAGVPYGGGGAGSCKITVNESTVTINTEANTAALVYFPKKYDLTNYNTLYFNGSFQKGSGGDGKCGVGVWKTIPSSDAAAAATAILEDFSQEDTYAIDTSKVTGEHYVGIVVWGFGDKYAATATMKQLYLK